MPLPTLEHLLTTETDRIEWTVSLVDTKVYQAVSALANDLGNSNAPGYLLLGVDNSGAVRGLDEEALAGTTRPLRSSRTGWHQRRSGRTRAGR